MRSIILKNVGQGVVSVFCIRGSGEGIYQNILKSNVRCVKCIYGVSGNLLDALKTF